VGSISFMTGPIRNQARRVVPLDQRRATTGMTGEESPAAHRATAGAAQRDVPRMRAAPEARMCQEKAPTEGCLVGAQRWSVDREAYTLILFRRESPDKAIFWAEPIQL